MAGEFRIETYALAMGSKPPGQAFRLRSNLFVPVPTEFSTSWVHDPKVGAAAGPVRKSIRLI